MLPSITVCDMGQSSPDADHLSFVYFAAYPERTVETDDGSEIEPPYSQLRHALFRRGADGQWRWLSAVAKFNSSRYYESCGTPSDMQ